MVSRPISDKSAEQNKEAQLMSRTRLCCAVPDPVKSIDMSCVHRDRLPIPAQAGTTLGFNENENQRDYPTSVADGASEQ